MVHSAEPHRLCGEELVFAMTLRCHFLGHRRSASRAGFDEKRGYWISNCKRCHILLRGDSDGKGKPLPPQLERPEAPNREPEAVPEEATEAPAEEAPVASEAAYSA